MKHRITDIRTIAVPVTDQDRALEFYTKTLGFEVRMDAPLPQIGGRWIVVAPPGAGAAIALTPASDDTPVGTDTGIRLATADAAAAHADLTAQGVDTGDLLTWPGIPPMFTLQDPDHNRLYLVQD